LVVGDHAHIHRHRPRRPHRAYLALLQHAQQLDLEGGRGLADLVEQDGTAAGLAEQTLAVLGGAGVGAAAGAEELGLEQGVG